MVGLYTQAQAQNTLLVGTYTKGTSYGIYVYDFASNTKEAVLIDSVKSSNPSYLAVAPNGRYVYAVNEDGSNNGGGKVSAYAFDKASKKLSLVNQVPSVGDHPCYITVDRKNKWVVVGNYSSGTLSVLPIAPDGGIGAAVTNMQHQGQSINKERQKSPHVHATVFSPDGKYLLAPDLGIDQIVMYAFNAKTGFLKPKKEHVKVTPGSGPRHLDFHPNGKWAYLAQELSGTVTAFKYDKGELLEQQQISMLPADYDGAATSADIHVSPNGRFLYASNRNPSNTIAIFSINPEDGKLTLVGHQSAMGTVPRNFNFDPSGKLLLVANQESNNIVIFDVDPETGLLTYTGKQIAVPNPVCIQWIKN